MNIEKYCRCWQQSLEPRCIGRKIEICHITCALLGYPAHQHPMPYDKATTSYIYAILALLASSSEQDIIVAAV
jgi:hypothetical protein